MKNKFFTCEFVPAVYGPQVGEILKEKKNDCQRGLTVVMREYKNNIKGLQMETYLKEYLHLM